MDEVHLDRGTIELLAVVRGLSSETLTVRRAIESVRPEVIGLSIGPEELRTLRSYDGGPLAPENFEDRKSTRLNSSHQIISYAVFCLKKKKIYHRELTDSYLCAAARYSVCRACCYFEHA